MREGGISLALSAIERAASQPGEWSGALAALAEAAGARIATLLPISPSHKPLASPSGAELVEDYARAGWASRNPRIAGAMKSDLARQLRRAMNEPGRSPLHSYFVSESELFPDREFEGTEFYEDFLARHRLRWSCGAPVLTPSNEVFFVTLERASDAVPFSVRELDTLKSVIGSIQWAISLSAMAASGELRGLLAAYDGLDLAAFAIDWNRRVCSWNEAGERLAQAEGLIVNRRMTAITPTEQAAIDGLIAHTLATTLPLRQTVPVLRQCRRGTALILHGLALPKPYLGAFGPGCAIIIATRSDRRLAASQAVLKSLYGFTNAEAKVAYGIGAGRTPGAIAHEHGVALATVRTQIKSIFAKCGAKRQADLIHILKAAVLN